MISYSEALQLVQRYAGSPQAETLPLLDALGRIAADDVRGAMDVPGFRNSAMDGFAVCRADIATATLETPVTLPILQAIAAGDVPQPKKSMGVVQIMTGAPIPEGCDAVIPIEDVTLAADTVRFTRPAKPNENIRFPGEDVKRGQTLIRRGDTVTPERIMLLAALGVAELEICKIPALHLLSTGKEIVDHAGALPEGKIHNSNAPYLLARAAEMGQAARYGGIIADDEVEFEQCIRAIPEGSLIITTGAVSKGTWDFIPASLNRLGAITHFHRVNIRPGKPVLFATLPNGNLFFGLPGNPISTAIGFRFFVQPALRALQGLAPETPLMARLENSFTKKGSFRQFLKANLRISADGTLSASVASGQESFKINPMAEGNAWVVLEEHCMENEAGNYVPVFPFGNAVMWESKEALPCKAA